MKKSSPECNAQPNHGWPEMKSKQQRNLINHCATVAASAHRISAYVILYTENDGSISYHRDGTLFSQIGLVNVCSKMLTKGFGEAQNDVEDT